MAVDPGRILRTREAEALGRTQRDLSREVGTGALTRLHRGAQITTAEWTGLGRTERFLYRVHAVAGALDRRVVLSHWAAAVLLDLPVRSDDSTPVDLTVEPGTNRRLRGVRAHELSLPDEDVVLIGGLLCTSWARTVVDIAAAAPFRDAVVIADAALHRVPPTGREAARLALEAAWSRAQPRRAVTKVRDVLDFADGASGSVGESMSRVTMRALGLPAPVLQQRFFDAEGFVGDSDFWFPEFGVIGETDGRVKYTDPEMTKGEPERVLYDEKVREDRLRALDQVRGFVRWDYFVGCIPSRLGPRLARAGVKALPRSRMRSRQT